MSPICLPFLFLTLGRSLTSSVKWFSSSVKWINNIHHINNNYSEGHELPDEQVTVVGLGEGCIGILVIGEEEEALEILGVGHRLFTGLQSLRLVVWPSCDPRR